MGVAEVEKPEVETSELVKLDILVNREPVDALSFIVHKDSATERGRKMCEKLNIQLHTYVMDWPTMKELTRAVMLSGLANLDVPQRPLFASVVPMMAKK